GPVILQRREIEFRHRLLTEFQAAHVCNHSDDLEPEGLSFWVSATECDPLINRVFVGKYFVHELLVDHHHGRSIRVIAIRVSTTLDHGNAHRAKVIRSY